MARLIYSTIMSLDGYIADADGRFEWAAPDEEVHAFVNELYGRRTSACDGHHGDRHQEPRPVDSYLAHAARRPHIGKEFVEDLG
jgi:hypothetical protein